MATTTEPYYVGLDQVDEATLAVIMQVLSEDMAELQNLDKGKHREGEKTDAQLAMEAHQNELQQLSNVLADRNMSRSLARAVIADSALLTDAVAKEDSFANDRIVAERLSRGEEVPYNTGAVSENPTLDNLFIARLTGLYVSDEDSDCVPPKIHAPVGTAPESSQWAAEREATGHQCVSCGEQRRLFETFRAPCDHFYCEGCLSRLFELAITDETLFPPRCCRQGIPVMSARLYLDSELFRRFQEKAIEYQTRNRTYCARPTCSAFIPSGNINGDRATCTACSTDTCTVCKGNSHDGDCPFDTATQQLLEAAQEHGWQRCHNCRRIVELNIGCNHMTCPCGAQFCYVCGERWKTCGCPQWHEDRLTARAEQVVARNQLQPAVQATEHAAQVRQAVEHLRDRHNCTHERWRYVQGPNRCEECYYNLPQYIFECRQCQLRACNRCRRNRL